MLRRMGRFAVATAACLLALSCSKRITRVEDVPDPGRYPEGLRDSTYLVVYLDTPSVVKVYKDNAADADSAGRLTGDDPLVGTEDHYVAGPGVVQGMIIDSTFATRFQVFRGEQGRFLPLRDFAFRSTKPYQQTHWEVYHFTDGQPVPATVRTYVGRGVVSDVVNGRSPLTNVAIVPGSPVPGDLVFTAKTGLEFDCQSCGTQPDPDACFRSHQCPDSLLYMEWEAVPGAAGYWIQVYQLGDQSGDEVILSGVAAPLYLGLIHEFFVGYLPEASTERPGGQPNRRSYRIGDPLPQGGRILSQRAMATRRDYTVRISAIGPSGEMLSYTGDQSGLRAFRVESSDGVFFRVFPVGGAIVHPERIAAP